MSWSEIWSWSDRLRKLRLGLLAAPLALTGCFQPLYGTLGPGVMESELQSIKVEPIKDRLGHYVGDELIFGLNGSRAEVPPKYRLVVNLKERVQTPVVDTVTFRTTSATVVTDAEFFLYTYKPPEPVDPEKPKPAEKPLYKSVAFAAASYDRFAQRTSNVRAARDAEVRDARVLADNIREQISAYFARRGS